MLAYDEDRLEDTYIPNLRLSLKSCNTVFNDANNDKFTTARNELSVLQNQTFSGLKAGQRLIGRHGTLVTKAYDLRRSKVVEELLQTSPKSTKQTRKLWVDICFLVTGDTIPQKTLKDALKLRDTLNLLDLPTDTLTVETVIGPSWTVAKAERDGYWINHLPILAAASIAVSCARISSKHMAELVQGVAMDDYSSPERYPRQQD
ncbi:hypothetical protein BTUL_0089g00490 [Botrytis tulipae]|uniref:Uncharacterized protein n=1 Tax=Botrytis tulipae TaxID=87230 RepID=A0A4Z1EIT0_9HELO|nr:hypothetical protein BTUL_0089g00490 [Botrytis tulipae]